jgi:tRNA threonylcarbamoyl adenosine modification protein YeaZ
MSLVLAIETSSPAHTVAVGDGDSPAAQRSARREDPGFAGLGDLTAQLLAAAGAAFSDIGTIAVDIGPGGLSSIRSAVAYANGLAFSLGVPVFPISSLELMAIDAQLGQPGPVLCLKRAQGGNLYAGLFDGGETLELRHGRPDSVLPAIAAGLPTLRVAGGIGFDLPALLPGVAIVDTGIADADVTILYRAARGAIEGPDRLVDAADALNEGSLVFHKY